MDITMDGIRPSSCHMKEPYTIKVKTRKHKSGFRTKEIWGMHYYYDVTIEQWNYMRDNDKWPKMKGRYDSQSVEVINYNRACILDDKESMWNLTPIHAAAIAVLIAFCLVALFGWYLLICHLFESTAGV